MNYELAKKLQEAGFPLKVASLEDSRDSKRKKHIFQYGKDTIGRDGYWLFPTLEELIEAVGDEFLHLTQCTLPFARWSCDSSLEDIDVVYGSTPSIAVANLWLSLHEKK